MQHNHLLLLLLLLAFPQCFAWTTLTPPAGNSIFLKAKTLKGFQYHRCVDGNRILESSNAVLVDINNPSQRIGSYFWVRKVRYPQHAGTWHLFNSPGDYAESGSKSSHVTGRKVFTSHVPSPHTMPNFLALAVNHVYQGTASMVSYIARLSTDESVAINNVYCEYDNKITKLPLNVEFHFWKQDLVPPHTPMELVVPLDRPIQGFFGQGSVTYVYDGHKWSQKSIAAQLYDVPGGAKKGSYFIKSVSDSEDGTAYWHFDNPNGFEIVGRSAHNPVHVNPNALPWTLNIVTSSSSNSAMFGSYSHVQMVSTTGGLPPLQPLQNLTSKPKTGQLWESSFTAIYWIYCKRSP